MRPALLQETLPDGRVRCGLCERRCGIVPGDRGLCGTRENREGTLHTLTWGLVASLAANPIEKKPLYHFFPGSVARRTGFEPVTVGSEVLMRFNADSAFQQSPSPILARLEALADGFESGDTSAWSGTVP